MPPRPARQLLERAFAANLIRVTMVPLLLLLACGGGGSTQKSDGATEQSDTSGLTSCQTACANYASVCGPQNCAIDCSGDYSTFEGPACDRELDVLYRCLAAVPGTQIPCGSDFLSFVDARKCPAEFNAAALCRSTKGADCLAEPSFDESCSVTNKPPHFSFCRAGVQPPMGCQDFGGTTGWFCCP